MNTPQLLTVPQAAKRMGVVKTTLHKMLQAGEIEHLRLRPRVIRINAEAVEAVLAQAQRPKQEAGHANANA